MENIEQFIKGCKTFGLKDGDIFQTADLYECQNMSQVRQFDFHFHTHLGGGQPEKRRKKTMSILGFYKGGSSFFDLNFIWV